MRHAGGEDGFILVPEDRSGEVMVELWPLDVLEAHSDRDQLVPGSEDFGLEEVRSVVGREGLIDLEGCDFCRD